MDNIDKLFSNPSKNCPISSLTISSTEDGAPMRPDLGKVVKFDDKTNVLTVKNNLDSIDSFDFFIRASTIG